MAILNLDSSARDRHSLRWSRPLAQSISSGLNNSASVTLGHPFALMHTAKNYVLPCHVHARFLDFHALVSHPARVGICVSALPACKRDVLRSVIVGSGFTGLSATALLAILDSPLRVFPFIAYCLATNSLGHLPSVAPSLASHY